MEVLSFILKLFANLSPKKTLMITRKSFFIRWLLFRNEECRQEERSVIDIEHIQSGCKRRVSSLEEASQWMREVEAEQKEIPAVEN